MQHSSSQIRCPNCGTPIRAPIEQLIDVGHDPGAKARLLSGSLNLVRCGVCGYEGQIATPLVYHDPEKELLLTFMPVEVGLSKDDQERFLGQLINQAINRLPPERRKGYLLQPQAVLTLSGLVERILEADGITREEIEAQRAKMRLLEELLRTPEEGLQTFVSEHDSELDAAFFQLANLTLQATREAHAREAAGQRLDQALALSSLGRKLQAQEEAVKAAAESLREAGSELTRQAILNLLIEAPDDDRVTALVNLTRPALDYTFFQLLTERIEAAQAEQKDRLAALRQRVLDITQQLDKAQEARAAQAASLLKSLMDAPDLDQAIQAALPLVDELFLGILQANMRAAEKHANQAALARLQLVDRRLQEILRDSLPPGLRLAQQLLETDDDARAEELLRASPDQIDDQLLGALMATAQQFQEAADKERAERLRRLHRTAVGIAMRAKMRSGKHTGSES
jgi:biotin operon repressor